MKKIIYLLALVFPVLVIGQTATENYIKTTTYQVETQNGIVDAISGATLTSEDKIEVVTYYDGLGRLKQDIAHKAGGDKEDIITPILYDDFGRQNKEYLPYARINRSLDIEDTDILITKINQQYLNRYSGDLNTGTPNPYSEKHFEASPLSRVLEQGAPGKDWAVNITNDNDHTIKFDYQTNSDADKVRLFTVSFPTGNTEEPQLEGDSFYQANELYKTVTKDENWQPNQTYPNDHTTEEYKDKLGRIVLKRTFNINKWHDTYYVYDDYGNLTFVLPPKVSTYSLLWQQDDLSEYSGSIGNDFSLYSAGHQRTSNSGYYYLNSSSKSIYFSFYDYYSSTPFSLNDGELLEFDYPFMLPNVYGQLISTRDANQQWETGHYSASIVNNKVYISGDGSTVTGFYLSFSINIGDVQLSGTPITNAILDDLAYQYKYDYRNRLVEKKVPGKGLEYIIYDGLDRPVMTQDANLRANNKWIVTKYDIFSRLVYTGLYTDTTYTTRESMQNHFDSQNNTPASLYESKVTSGTGYNNTYYTGNNFPANMGVNSVNYYDDYNFDRAGIATPTSADCYDVTPTTKTKGLMTGSKVIVLGQGFWTTSMNYYDEKARTIYTASKSQWLNTEDIVANKLDFTGKVLETTSKHKFASNGWITTVDKFTYDHIGRLISHKKNIDNQGEELIVKNHYDELGQLIKKDVGNSEVQPLQEVDYNYNIRGWLKSINNPTNLVEGNDLFAFGINYNEPQAPSSSSSHNQPLYNGNISHTYWNTNNADGGIRHYAYKYDALNRFKYAFYGEKGSMNNKYNAYIYEYDRNGNINRLNRYIPSNLNDPNSTSSTSMDNLTYTYDDGNKLLSVSDSNGTSTNGLEGFVDGNTSGNDYAYDSNGNLLSDANKSIGNIEYNHLNLPTKITIGGGPSVDPATGIITFTPSNYLKYTYDALGNKLRAHKDLASTSHDPVYYYSGNYVYSYGNGNYHLQYIKQPEGYIEHDGSGGYDYVYQYKDHLGSIRLSYKDSDDNGIIDGENTYTTIWEDGFEGPTSGWDGTGASWGHPLDAYDTSVMHSGNRSGRIDVHSGYSSRSVHSLEWTPVNNAQDTKYVISGWVFIEDIPQWSRARLELMMKEEGETGYMTLYEYQYVDPKGKWVYVEKTLTVPAHIKYVNSRITFDYNSSATSGSVWFDDLKIQRINPTNNSEILEENNYYPFGGRHRGYNTVVNSTNPALKYMYNGKELNDELGYNVYDFDARHYDPWTGRWLQIDPLAEDMTRFSPYNYAFGNPIYYIDPDGMSPFDNFLIYEDGSILRQKTDSKSDTFTYVDGDGTKHEIGTYNKNDKGLIQTPSIDYESGDTSVKISTKSGNESRSNISGTALASLIGASADSGQEISVVSVSNADGTSPSPSKSHVNGKNLDIRYAGKNNTRNPIDYEDSKANFDKIDQTASATMNASLKKFGYKDIRSSTLIAPAKEIPMADGTKRVNMGRYSVSGTTHLDNHYNHEHLQGYRPNVTTRDYATAVSRITARGIQL